MPLVDALTAGRNNTDSQACLQLAAAASLAAYHSSFSLAGWDESEWFIEEVIRIYVCANNF